MPHESGRNNYAVDYDNFSYNHSPQGLQTRHHYIHGMFLHGIRVCSLEHRGGKR